MPSDPIINIYISGVHSGPNPLPGIGVAKSIKKTSIEANIVAVDYSPDSTGLYWDGFDSSIVLPPWSERSQRDHIDFVVETTSKDNTFWISCLDLEVETLSTLEGNERILSPKSQAAMQFAKKPPLSAARALNFLSPNQLRLPAPPAEIHQFLADNVWQCWLKPQNYGAFPVRSWQEYVSSKRAAESIWGDADYFLEQHIAGEFISFAFSAFRGELLSLVKMTKTDVTAEGKTWSGSISHVPPSITKSIEEFCITSNWTGGAELECIVDGAGNIYLMEINPRFPAWIFGSTLCGPNLPGILIEKALGRTTSSNTHPSGEFCRVISEVRKAGSHIVHKNIDPHHPSGMPSLTRALARQRANEASSDEILPQKRTEQSIDSTTKAKKFQEIDISRPSPYYFLNEMDVAENISLSNDWAGSLDERLPKVHFAYSCKTNPNSILLSKAKQYGWKVDAISQLEVKHCLKSGFPIGEIILNGPGKFWPDSRSVNTNSSDFFSINFDSIPEAERYISEGLKFFPAQRLALRIRPAGFNSRFGTLVPMGADNQFYNTLVKLSQFADIGLHLHLSPSSIGDQWINIVERINEYINWFNSTNPTKKINFVDLGGGWTPTSWRKIISTKESPITKLLVNLKSSGVSDVIFEPGKCILQDSGTLVCRVIDIRSNGNQTEVVVDGAINMIPDWASHHHGIDFANKLGESFNSGETIPCSIYGRTCMESDILSINANMPMDLKISDFLLIRNCGAYDFSMAVPFGAGFSFADFSDF